MLVVVIIVIVIIIIIIREIKEQLMCVCYDSSADVDVIVTTTHAEH